MEQAQIFRQRRLASVKNYLPPPGLAEIVLEYVAGLTGVCMQVIDVGPLANPMVALPGGRLAVATEYDHRRPMYEQECPSVRVLDLTGETRARSSGGESIYTLARVLDLDNQLAAGSGDNRVRIIDAASGLILRRLDGPSPAKALAALRGGLIAVGHPNGDIRIWCTIRGKLLRTFSHYGMSVSALAALTDGSLAAGYADGAIWVWSAGGIYLRRLKGHVRSVNALAVLGKGLLASASNDGTVRIWTAAGGECMHTVRHTAVPYSLALLADGSLAVGYLSGDIHVLNAEDGKILLAPLKGHESCVCALAALPDGRLASNSKDKTIRVWA